MAELLPQEEALMSRAREAESAREGAFEQMAPSGDFPVGDLNALVDSLNQVLPMFKLPAYPSFAEDIDGPLPGEFVQQLSMVADAADAAGLERLSFDVATATDSAGLEDIQAEEEVPSDVPEDAPPFDVAAAQDVAAVDEESLLMERM